MADKTQLSNMNTRQKVTAGIAGVIMLIVIWQIYGMFGGGHRATSVSSNAPAPSNQPRELPPPKQVTEVASPAPTTPQDQEIQKMQQDAERQYLTDLNNLQKLRLQASAAVISKEIAAAQLDRVKSEKQIVELLSAPSQPQGEYAQNLANQSAKPATQAAPVIQVQVPYTLVSVTETQDVWSAVIGNQGTLYHIRVGDVLPPDGSTVVAISRTSVTLEKEGERRKLNLVAII